MTLSNLADYCYCVLNDMKHIHFHIVGKHFKLIHELAQEYYDELAYNYDSIVEKALELKESVSNPTLALRVEYQPITSDELDREDSITAMTVILSELIKRLEETRLEYNGIIDSFIDPLLDFWKKEVYYKLERTGDD